MKSFFPGYYSTDSIDTTTITNAIVVFDNNLLLEVYKLPEKDAYAIIDIIKKAKLKLWMPYCMAIQYHLRLNLTIENEVALYNLSRKKINELHSSFSLPLIQLTDDQNKITDAFFKEADSIFESAIDILKTNLSGSSSLRNKIADLYSTSVGTEDQDPHPYNVKGDATEVSAEANRSLYNSSVVANESLDYIKLEKIAFNSVADRSKEMKSPVILVLSSSQECLYLNSDNGYSTVKQDIQNYFMNKSDGQQLYCFSFESFMKKLEDCKKIKVPDSVYASIQICSSHLNQGCRYLGDDWYKL